MVRIDSLQPGAMVRLRFAYSDPEESEPAVFCGITGSGDDRRARFVQATDGRGLFDWEAYRFEGRWCYGTSAQRLSVVEVVDSFPLGTWAS